MIDWAAIAVVGGVSFVGATVLVSLYALGLRLLSSDGGPVSSGRRLAAVACFALCAAGVLYGVYLIVPALH